MVTRLTFSDFLCSIRSQNRLWLLPETPKTKTIKNENKTKGNDEKLREGDWVTWEMGSVD